MKKIRTSKKGFTLAELLIVVAIIGVLVGISIPIFSAQLKKSRVATNQANARAAYAAAKAAYLDTEGTRGGSYVVDTGVFTAVTTAPTEGTAISTTAIKDWKVDGNGFTSELDDKIATTWYVALDENGNVTSISATFPS
ncbi:MAG: prepilin-type N-terminal cleavage/methylation domain-containing protein [Clostridiales bacterium]|nr:prepilin-type N-terminal cleavage/methylation domain-containing protein [Clostridiales bacterium]